MSWWSRLRNRGQAEERLDAELRDHVERLVAQHVRAGTADLPSRRARLLAAVQASLALVCPRRLHRRLSMLAQLLFADLLALPGNRRRHELQSSRKGVTPTRPPGLHLTMPD